MQVGVRYDKNIESKHAPEVRLYVEAYTWKLTSLLLVTLPKSLLLSVTHVNHFHFSAMQADTTKIVTWLLRYKYCIAKVSSQADQA